MDCGSVVIYTSINVPQSILGIGTYVNVVIVIYVKDVDVTAPLKYVRDFDGLHKKYINNP